MLDDKDFLATTRYVYLNAPPFTADLIKTRLKLGYVLKETSVSWGNTYLLLGGQKIRYDFNGMCYIPFSFFYRVPFYEIDNALNRYEYLKKGNLSGRQKWLQNTISCLVKSKLSLFN